MSMEPNTTVTAGGYQKISHKYTHTHTHTHTHTDTHTHTHTHTHIHTHTFHSLLTAIPFPGFHLLWLEGWLGNSKLAHMQDVKGQANVLRFILKSSRP